MQGIKGKADAPPSPRLRQVLAANGGPMTGPGTTTFILGQDEVVIIDPGPEDPAHLAALRAALAPGERVAAILVTHPHLDHSQLAPRLSQVMDAPVLGFGPAGSGRTPRMAALTGLGLTGGSEGIDHAFRPDEALTDGQVLQLAGMALTVHHTPGHMGEHLSFRLGQDLFCGDLVMGWAPSLVSPPEGDMSDYMCSLGHVQGLAPARLLPTHGAAIADPAARLSELIAHRLARKAQIIEALSQEALTLEALTRRVYHAVAPALWPAASRNLLAHLIELMGEERVEASPWPAPEARFALCRTDPA